MKKIKSILFKTIIIYIISYIFLTSSFSSYAKIFDASDGEKLANYATQFVQKYGGNSSYYTNHSDVKWGGGSFGSRNFLLSLYIRCNVYVSASTRNQYI